MTGFSFLPKPNDFLSKNLLKYIIYIKTTLTLKRLTKKHSQVTLDELLHGENVDAN